MNAVVIQHVPVAELPEKWRTRLHGANGALVTIRIEQETLPAPPTRDFVTDDPAFGIWRDRQDIADVPAHVRQIRQPRYRRDGSRHQP